MQLCIVKSHCFDSLWKMEFLISVEENTKQDVAAAKRPYSSTQLMNILPLQLVPTAL